jgi:hypothetical protein
VRQRPSRAFRITIACTLVWTVVTLSVGLTTVHTFFYHLVMAILLVLLATLAAFIDFEG